MDRKRASVSPSDSPHKKQNAVQPHMAGDRGFVLVNHDASSSSITKPVVADNVKVPMKEYNSVRTVPTEPCWYFFVLAPRRYKI